MNRHIHNSAYLHLITHKRAINLLPWRLQRRYKQLKLFSLMMFGSAILGILCIAWQHANLTGQLEWFENQASAAREHYLYVLDQQFPFLPDGLNSQQLQKLFHLQNSLAQRHNSLAQLSEIARIVPASMRLTELQYLDAGVVLGGSSTNSADLSLLFKSLLESTLFLQPSIQEQTTQELDDQLSHQFTLIVKTSTSESF